MNYKSEPLGRMQHHPKQNYLSLVFFLSLTTLIQINTYTWPLTPQQSRVPISHPHAHLKRENKVSSAY